MKSATAYYLLLLYLSLMLQPLLPVVADAWSHAFNTAVHLATVHAQQGNNHLQSEMAEKGADFDTGRQQNAQPENPFTKHIYARNFQLTSCPKPAPETHYPNSTQLLPAPCIFVLAPPPRHCLSSSLFT